LPKDSAGMNALAKKIGIDLPLVSNVNTSNSLHIDHIVRKIELCKNDFAGVMIAGVSFKKGTNDIRMSPSVELCMKIDSLGLKIALRDDLLFSSPSVGENKALLQDIQNRYLIYDSAESYSNWLIINIHKYEFPNSIRERNTIISIQELL
jgi:UDP-glucose 6-dehydrogenase